MEEQRIDSFKLLLNEISHELKEENLRSLIHISGVPGGSLDSIKDGHTLFRYLIDVDFISKEKVGNLRKLLRRMRPRRRDLVRLVDNYIKEEYKTDDVSLVLDDFSQSWEQVPNPAVFNCDSSHAIPEVLFNLDCAYMNCVCHRFPSCYLPLIILLALAMIVTCIFWYADVPKVSRYINADEDLKKAGVYIIIAQCLVLFLLIGRYAWKQCGHRGYVNFVNPTVQEESAARLNDTSSGSTMMVDTAEKARVISPPRTYKYSSTSNSYGSPESAVFSDQSGAGSVSTVDAMEPQDV